MNPVSTCIKHDLMLKNTFYKDKSYIICQLSHHLAVVGANLFKGSANLLLDILQGWIRMITLMLKKSWLPKISCP